MVTTPAPGVFDGMSTAQLQAALAEAQQALIQLSTGAKGVTFSYAQGDGVKTVSYQPTSVAQLTMLIRQLQQALGLAGARRRPMRMLYL